MPELVIAQHQNGVATLTLNRPERANALGPEMVEGLEAGLAAAEQGGARLLVLRGTGAHFCSGFDLTGLEDLSNAALLERFIRVELLLQRVHAAPMTTLALAAGRTYGAGADLFAACDRRLADPGARFAFPGSGFGLVLGTGRLAARIGESAARTVLLDGHELDAEQAVRLGLATAVVPQAGQDAAIGQAARAAGRLDAGTVRQLHQASRPGAQAADDAALAALVRSASRPGLRDRILAYRAALRGPKG